MDLKDIEIVDILPHIGDTGVILLNQQRGSQFNMYATSIVTAEIINVIGDPVDPNPDITIEYSTSNDPIRFDQLGNSIGTGIWSLNPPENIINLRSIKITTRANVILKPYDRLIINFSNKVPVGVSLNQIAYNSFAVRANKIVGQTTEPLLATEPNKVAVKIVGNTGGSIGDFVWEDLNENGIYDPGEPGLNGVTVELYSEDGVLLDSSITSNNAKGDPGYYLFTGLEEGVYQVKFTPFGGHSLTQEVSSLENGSKPNPNTGFTSFITLSRDQNILDIDAGVVIKVCDNSRFQAVTDIIESIALEQTALSHILNAEGEKIEKAKDLDLPLKDLLKINKSVKNMIDAVVRLETILQIKLETFECNKCDSDSCKDFNEL